MQVKWEDHEDSPGQKEDVSFGKPRASLPWECERFFLFLLCLAGNPHWESNSEEILGGAGGSMDSQGNSVHPEKGEQGALLAKIPKLSFPFS